MGTTDVQTFKKIEDVEFFFCVDLTWNDPRVLWTYNIVPKGNSHLDDYLLLNRPSHDKLEGPSTTHLSRPLARLSLPRDPSAPD